MATVQLNLDFEPGLTHQYPQFIDLIAAVIYTSRGGLSAMANELDVSPSHLSRILSRRDPEDVRHFDLNWLPLVIQHTGDRRPISWLIEKFMEDPAAKRNQMVEQLAAFLPLAMQFIEQETGTKAKLRGVAR